MSHSGRRTNIETGRQGAPLDVSSSVPVTSVNTSPQIISLSSGLSASLACVHSKVWTTQ